VSSSGDGEALEHRGEESGDGINLKEESSVGGSHHEEEKK
jgi:hypothetical protein